MSAQVVVSSEAWVWSAAEALLPAKRAGVPGHRPGLQVEGLELLQPGGLVGREHAVRRARGGQHLLPLEDHVVLAGVQQHAEVRQPAAQALGLSNEIIQKGLQNLESVSGRFQRVDMGQPFLVIVDYAHTDDALENLIRTARELHTEGRIITLFGCGGLKDRTKRPVMGGVTGRLSDLTILSSDNPRTEDPLKIIGDIVVGLQKTAGKYLIEPDREKAIGLAMDEARAGDIVLLAGKGHQDYQVLADRTLDPPGDFGSEHTEALSTRDMGWLMGWSCDAQEAFDNHLIAYRIGEDHRVLLP